ncbi:serine/threonine protein kinase BUD32 [Aspergillus mulundensis]|uniref:EKC/KEOPS complex subunit BUD32 n=1 Tax=Aspergillus mulundensis TaxID=1810919 RepID=A0A3D8QZX0_9EURO|nr:EKC complex subunit bud32 [Aspergillus mulundensis]RDW67352.1 EKC complex subunit bud32 [Aspergillus mulundensis]
MPTAHPPPFSTILSSTPQPSPTDLTPIYQGAEAHLYRTTFLSSTTPAALKIRPSKPYRHPILDRRLTRARILQEARCLQKLVKEGVSVPALLGVDWEPNADNGSSWLVMEWVEGGPVRVQLERWERYLKGVERERGLAMGEGIEKSEEEKVRGLMRRIGGAVGGLHRAGVIHGDLTTSNLMLRPKSAEAAVDEEGEGSPSMEGDIVMIDFGLAMQSAQDEDRAVDLYVLERAFGSSHPRTERFFEEVLVGYKESYKGSVSALKRLEDVRMRGRKRSMIG